MAAGALDELPHHTLAVTVRAAERLAACASSPGCAGCLHDRDAGATSRLADAMLAHSTSTELAIAFGGFLGCLLSSGTAAASDANFELPVSAVAAVSATLSCRPTRAALLSLC